MNRAARFARNLAGVTREKRSLPPPFLDLLTGEIYGRPSRHNATVGYDQAQAHGAVYACVDLLVRIVAWQMPVFSGDVLSTAGVVVDPHPEPQMTAQHWRAEALQAALLRGYAAGIVTEFEPSGFPRKVLPLHPDLVSYWDDRGRWRWTADGHNAELWQTGGNLWVAPAPRVAPGQPVGMSVLRYAAQKINLGLSATKFGGNFFDANGMPIAHGKVLNSSEITQTQATALKERIMTVTRDREPLITGNNFELTAMPVNADESQFLETIQANDAQVAMFFGVPAESIGGSSGDSLTYATVEGRNLQLLTNTVGAWMVWFESLLSGMLPGVQTVTLDPESLLRTSVPALFNTAQVGVASGLLTRDEGRAMLGYGPGPPMPATMPDPEPDPSIMEGGMA